MRRFQVDLRLLGIAALAMVAGIAVHLATAPPERVELVTVDDHVAPGTPLEDIATRTRPSAAVPGLLTRANADDFDGTAIAIPLAPGDPIPIAALGDGDDSDIYTMAVTLDSAHAVQGQLVAGDLVDVYRTTESGAELLQSSVLIAGTVATESQLAGGSTVRLLIHIEPAIAPTLIAALAADQVDLVRIGR